MRLVTRLQSRARADAFSFGAMTRREMAVEMTAQRKGRKWKLPWRSGERGEDFSTQRAQREENAKNAKGFVVRAKSACEVDRKEVDAMKEEALEKLLNQVRIFKKCGMKDAVSQMEDCELELEVVLHGCAGDGVSKEELASLRKALSLCD